MDTSEQQLRRRRIGGRLHEEGTYTPLLSHGSLSTPELGLTHLPSFNNEDLHHADVGHSVVDGPQSPPRGLAQDSLGSPDTSSDAHRQSRELQRHCTDKHEHSQRAHGMSEATMMPSDALAQAGPSTAMTAPPLAASSSISYPSPAESASLQVNEASASGDQIENSDSGGADAEASVTTPARKTPARKRASKVVIDPKEHAKLVRENTKLKKQLDESRNLSAERIQQVDRAQQEIQRCNGVQDWLHQRVNQLEYDVRSLVAGRDNVVRELQDKQRYWEESTRCQNDRVAKLEAELRLYKSTAANSTLTSSTTWQTPNNMPMHSPAMNVFQGVLQMPPMPPMPPMMQHTMPGATRGYMPMASLGRNMSQAVPEMRQLMMAAASSGNMPMGGLALDLAHTTPSAVNNGAENSLDASEEQTLGQDVGDSMENDGLDYLFED